jgi:predicted nucleic acid-binding Zn ribbon protein
VGDSVARVLRHLGAPTAGALETVFGEWPRLVGDRIAAHAEPVSVQRGTLTVRASDATWANQLRWLEGDLLRRLEGTLGPGVIESIEVRLEPPGGRAPVRARGPRPSRGGRGQKR